MAYQLAEKPSWGYEIIAKIYGKLQILLSPGVVYPLLHNMERKGLVKREKYERKEVYSLTSQGKQWLRQMLDATAYENLEFLYRYLHATTYKTDEEEIKEVI
ncbi:MAG: PadR family transcriptional regulator [Candidatus Hecatellaceae archaeon]